MEAGDTDRHAAPSREGWAARLAAIATPSLAWVAAVITLATCVAVSWIGFYDAPNGDSWLVLSEINRLDKLLIPHNEHPIFFGRIAFWIDWNVFEGRGRFLQFVTLALLAAQVPAFVWLARETGIRRPLLTVAPFAIALVLASREYHNFVWPFQASFVPAFTLALWSFAAFATWLQRGARTLLILAVALAAIATMSLASGGFAALALAGMAIVFGRRWLALLFAAMAIGGLSLSFLAASGSGTISVLSVPSIVRFFFAYLGAPAAAWGADATIAAGVVTTAAAAAACAYVMWRRRDQPFLVALAGVIVFGFLNVAVTALGRSFGADIFGLVNVAAGSRYHVVLGLIYLATGIVAIDALRTSQVGRRLLPLLSPVTAGLLVVASLAGIAVVGTMNDEHRRDTWGVTGMVAGVDDIAVTDLAGFFAVLGRRDIVPPRIVQLRAERKSVFAEQVVWRIGESLTAAELALPVCEGSAWTTSAQPGSPDGHRRAQGQFSRTQDSAGASHILIADPTGAIVGYGRVPRRASDLNPLAAADGKSVDWQGHVRPAAQQPLTAWLSTADTVRCSLGAASSAS